MAPAASFATVADAPGPVQRALGLAFRKVQKPSAVLAFASGGLAGRLDALAKSAAEACPGVPCVLASGAGVLTENGEHEGVSAAAGLVVSGGTASVIVAPQGDPSSLVSALSFLGEAEAATFVVFADPGRFRAGILVALARAFPKLTVIGGGTAAAPTSVDAEGNIRSGAIAGLVFRKCPPPRTMVSPGCRVLGPPAPVTESNGSMVIAIDGEPALDRLGRVASDLPDRPLVLALLLRDEDSAEGDPRDVGVLRPIRGIDPGRKAIVVGDDIRAGDRIAFAALDAPAARAHFDEKIRGLGSLHGAGARFGLFVNCGGRGRGLYGVDNVDSRALKARFGELPFAGLSSSFEIGPSPRGPAVHLYSGVFALFTTPS